LCAEGKSVLITALTNRALIEVASKKASLELLEQGCILKSNLTVDEQKELPLLKPLKQILPIKGALTMATYYIVSGFAADLTEEGVFDVVIMDEASQALLAMFAAANKIGKKQLWVGDIAQLGPVLSLNNDRVLANSFEDFKDG
jgi:superfamily I DNA and/or RNA helicase